MGLAILVMGLVIFGMGILIFILMCALADESVKAAKLETEVRMLRERYEPDSSPKE